uniref:Uncharacterized protein n=1 Tax=Tanacetum cinerariifolium TaxID=118510 RepID=A0A699I0Z5_TANCI|nr:hypothetical protein [Tanacetum cinerariifolium]
MFSSVAPATFGRISATHRCHLDTRCHHPSCVPPPSWSPHHPTISTTAAVAATNHRNHHHRDHGRTTTCYHHRTPSTPPPQLTPYDRCHHQIGSHQPRYHRHPVTTSNITATTISPATTPSSPPRHHPPSDGTKGCVGFNDK